MKVLITGGAGFIGSNYAYIRFQTHPEDEIFVLDKLTYAGNLDNLSGLRDEKRFSFVEGDIVDKSFLEDLFGAEKFDLVVNFAAETHVDRSISGPSIFVMTNVVGTQNLLEVARENGVKRFHHVSTDEVYGDLGSDRTSYFVEESALKPNSPYAASKAAADLLVRSYFETYNLPVTVSRCGNNYGPYQFPEKLIPYFFYLLSQNKTVPVYGDGQHIRDWIYVKDHCQAIDMIIDKGRIGEIYNVGGKSEKNNLEITKILLDFLGKDESMITYVDDRLGHDRRYAIDPTKIENELGFKPSVTFEEGIKLTLDWYRENEKWVEKLRDRIEERKHKEISKTPLAPAKS